MVRAKEEVKALGYVAKIFKKFQMSLREITGSLRLVTEASVFKW